MSNLIIQSTLLLVCAGCLFIMHRRARSSLPLPPGPMGIPLLGNLLTIPRTHTWMYFQSLARRYGPLISLSIGRDKLLVLTDPEDAETLLGRRAHNYSSRKPLVYAGKYLSNNKRLVLLPYGDVLKRQRTAFHQMVQPRLVGGYETIQDIESTKLVYEMLVQPKHLERNCQRYAASLVFNLSYGRRLSDNDEDLASITGVLDGFLGETVPWARVVDTFPALDYLPDILAPWRVQARNRHSVEIKFYQGLADQVKQEMNSRNSGVECFAARLWEQQEKLGLDDEELAYIAGSAFEAGTDTTAGTMLWFLMAMALHPEVVREAHAEIDSVVGEDGALMPGFAHINQLPYCVALTKEIFRWAPPAPGGFPHYSDRDDEYKGFTIKAKTLVIPSIWAMHRSPDLYPDPDNFNPNRFMRDGTYSEHDSMTDGHYAFGFGRRRCPGQYLGSKTIWIAVVRMLWAFDIGPERDAQGKALPIDRNNCTSGMTSRPNPFPFRMTARSENHARTLAAAWEVHN